MVHKKYVWRSGDILTQVLYGQGLGRQKGNSQLYGADGWLQRNMRANPKIRNWGRIPVGTTVELVLPPSAAAKAPKRHPQKPAPQLIPKLAPTPPVEEPASAVRPEMPADIGDDGIGDSTDTATSDDPDDMAPKDSLRDRLALPRHRDDADLAPTWPLLAGILIIGMGMAAFLTRRLSYHGSIDQKNWRLWQRQVVRLLTCLPHNLDKVIEEVLSQTQPSSEAASLFDTVLWDAEEDLANRARVVYSRLGLAELDRLALVAERSQDRVSAARRITALADARFTKEIVDALDSTVRLSAGDLELPFAQLIAYDVDHVLQYMARMKSKSALTALVRSLASARNSPAVIALGNLLHERSDDADLVSEIQATLAHLEQQERPRSAPERSSSPRQPSRPPESRAPSPSPSMTEERLAPVSHGPFEADFVSGDPDDLAS